jgi:hypothetical protein
VVPTETQPKSPAVAQARPPPTTTPRVPREREGGGNVPNQATLLTRIQTLERDVEARDAAGRPVTKGGRDFLERLRLEAREANDAASRRELAQKINDWEKVYLGRR